MKISPARIAAFEILQRIERDNAYSSVLLPEYEEALGLKDRALCHELTLGVLRKKLYLDAIIDELSSGKKVDVEVRTALRLGIYQMMTLDRVPDHAVINDSVELVSYAKKRSAKGFANAILRSYQKKQFVPQIGDGVEGLALETSHPKWLVERWVRQFDFKRTRELCHYNNTPARSAFRIFGSNETTQNTLRELIDLGVIELSQHVQDCYVVNDFRKLPKEFVDNPNIHFQDEGSQLVGQIAAAEGGKQILDVCAAPGGKTLILAEGGGNVVAAGDLYPNRRRFLAEMIARHSMMNVSVVGYDAREFLPFEAQTFDIVLVDVPCSGTGTIQHNPEIRYTVSEDEIHALTNKQLLILQNASEMVKKGGVLVYSTCSLEEDENETVCRRFLLDSPNFSLKKSTALGSFLTDSGFVRTFPPADRMGGFFAAVFKRL